LIIVAFRRTESLPRDIPGLKDSTLTKATPIDHSYNPQINNNYYNVGPSLAGPIVGEAPDKNVYENWSDRSESSATSADITLSKQEAQPRDYASMPDMDDLSNKSTVPATSSTESDQISVETHDAEGAKDSPIDHKKVGEDEYAIPSLQRKAKANPQNNNIEMNEIRPS